MGDILLPVDKGTSNEWPTAFAEPNPEQDPEPFVVISGLKFCAALGIKSRDVKSGSCAGYYPAHPDCRKPLRRFPPEAGPPIRNGCAK